MQGQPVERITGTVVGETHVVVANLANGGVLPSEDALPLKLLERQRTRRVDDRRRLREHLHEAAEARVALLKRLGEIDELLDRRDENADVERVNGKIGHLKRALRHEVSAADDGHRVQHAHEKELTA